ncbi:hypothetical protein ACGFOU_18980, partial [Streptomyces sp. NPDC048595]|uniref:hypothetical protein n=1 Tax=Streptomyces sp. NPDC048595 TaxID=3365576 RepID=UPI0037185471
IARRRGVRKLGVSGRSDNAARCRSWRRAPTRDYGTALRYAAVSVIDVDVECQAFVSRAIGLAGIDAAVTLIL